MEKTEFIKSENEKKKEFTKSKNSFKSIWLIFFV